MVGRHTSLQFQEIDSKMALKAVLLALALSVDVEAFLAPRFVKPHAARLKMSTDDYDYDVIIIGCGVGGHGAALHAKSQGLKTCVLAGGDVGGTCVNRGCVPSKALLAASGRVREMSDVVSEEQDRTPHKLLELERPQTTLHLNTFIYSFSLLSL